MGEMGALVEDLSLPSYDRPSWRNNTNIIIIIVKGLTKIIIEEGSTSNVCMWFYTIEAPIII